MKTKLHIQNPNGLEILGYSTHLVGFRLLPTPKGKHGALNSTTKLINVTTPSDWTDIHLASQFSNQLAFFLPLPETITRLEEQVGKITRAIPLDTGLCVGRKGVVFQSGEKVIIAFEATKPNEMKMNAWTHAKDKKWSVPYARFWEGRQVQSFYLDMWLGMRDAALKGVEEVIDNIGREGGVVEKVILTGHSMGGGISTLAIMEIVNLIRNKYGSASPDPKRWALDTNLPNLIRHITFAEFVATGSDFNTHLNNFYHQYQIPAWDFVHPHDFTTRLHMPFFRSWRGHRYVLPKEAVRGLDKEYAAGRHDMPGYAASMEWLMRNPRVVRSLYAHKEEGKK